MRPLILLSLHHAVKAFRIDALRAHGTAPDKVIHTAERLGAKPTRYQPNPSNPPQSGKRRRQWR